MTVSFLISHKVLNDAFNKEIKSDFAIVCENVLDKLGNLFNFEKIELWISSQVYNKLESSKCLDYDQIIRLRAFFKEEKTTQGTSSFDINSSLNESAKNLSYTGTTIVIVEDSLKKIIESNPRISVLTPAEFTKTIETAEQFKEKLPFKENLMDLFQFCVFKPELKKTILDGIESTTDSCEEIKSEIKKFD